MDEINRWNDIIVKAKIIVDLGDIIRNDHFYLNNKSLIWANDRIKELEAEVDSLNHEIQYNT